MGKSIRLSEQHGVNPSLEVCFWCGEARGVALLGRLKGDAEAPREICVDYEPCDACKAIFDQGILLVEMSPTSMHENQTPVTKDEGMQAYPTGRYMVMKPDAIPVIFDEQMSDMLLKHRKAWIDPETFNMLMPNNA